MKSKDATALEMKELKRDGKKWFLEVPMQIRNEREIVRRATRDIDPPVRLSRKLDWIDVGILITCLCFGGLFLALYYGLLDWIPNLFR